MKKIIIIFALLMPLSLLSFAAEWPANNVATSSQIWPKDGLIDASTATIWSSKLYKSSANTEWLAYWFKDGFKPVSFITLTPRVHNGKALGFPEVFTIYYSDGRSWQYIREVRIPNPTSSLPVVVTLPKTYSANGIHIVANRLRDDGVGNYVFQLAGTSAGLKDEPGQGYLDSYENNLLRGWAKDADFTGSVRVEINVDGVFSAGILANQFRSDVGNHAFSHIFNPPLDVGTHKIDVYAISVDNKGVATGITTLLNGSPRTVNISSTSVQNNTAYPNQNPYQIKGLRPDFVLGTEEVIGNKAGNIGTNIVMWEWQPKRVSPPCRVGEYEYDKHCFTPPPHIVDQVRKYSTQNVNVTGVLYGVPAWARGRLPCTTPVSPGFCIPDDPADFARFAGMVAHFFDGTRGNGRVVNFVIHNEVNTNEWFDIGCTENAATCQQQRGEIYSKHFNAAYDQIIAQQKYAKVFISLDHHFFMTRSSDPTGTSGQKIVEAVNANAAGRQWRLAYHPYSINLFQPQFSPDDHSSKKVTFGNIGQLAGWLRTAFPRQPHAWEIHLTEQGFHTTSEAEQEKYLCRSFWNALGTPGIGSYLYHRELDFGAAEGGLNLGLIRSNHSYKPAWATWALVNRNDLTPKRLSCGFENLPDVALVRSYHPTRGHWASSRIPPVGFKQEAAWKLLRDPNPNTTLLYECGYLQHNFLSKDTNCENQPVKFGPVGFIYNAYVSGSVPVYRCSINNGQDHFISGDARCESQQTNHLLGYAMPCGANQCLLPK